ncbi:MAG TPA: hypothetical protein VGD29_09035 [Actinoplanes sp.]
MSRRDRGRRGGRTEDAHHPVGAHHAGQLGREVVHRVGLGQHHRQAPRVEQPPQQAGEVRAGGDGHDILPRQAGAQAGEHLPLGLPKPVMDTLPWAVTGAEHHQQLVVDRELGQPGDHGLGVPLGVPVVHRRHGHDRLTRLVVAVPGIPPGLFGLPDGCGLLAYGRPRRRLRRRAWMPEQCVLTSGLWGDPAEVHRAGPRRTAPRPSLSAQMWRPGPTGRPDSSVRYG